MKKMSILITLLLLLLGACQQTEKVTITFNVDGEITVKTIDKGQAITKPDDPSKEGYDFIGWFKDINDDQAYTQFNSVSESIILYAKWKIKTYQVQFIDEGVLVNRMDVNYNTLITSLELEEKELYYLVGWRMDDSDILFDFNTPVTKDLILNADWQLKTDININVTFMNGDQVYEQKIISFNTAVTQPNNPYKVGYQFIGWFLNQSDEEPYSFETKLKTDLVLYAKFKALPKPKIIEILRDEHILLWEHENANRFIIELDGASMELSKNEFDLSLYKDIISQETKLIITPFWDDFKGDASEIFVRYVEKANNLLNYEASFDEESKGAFAKADIEIGEGIWTFDDALLGTNANDKKNGTKSVRIRDNGSILLTTEQSMIEKITFYAATYGSDANATIEVFLIKDETEVLIKSILTTSVLTQYEIIIDYETISFAEEDGLQIKIIRTSPSSGRINLDDFYIYTYQNAYYQSYVKGEYLGYYETIDGLKGAALLLELRNIISKNIKPIKYEMAKTILEVADRDPNQSNHVLTIYDRQSVKGAWSGAWHREHVWPNSRLGIPRVKENEVSQASDPHNLRAIIPGINSSRSNRYYDVGNSDYNQTVGSHAYFPGKEDKGDVARILMYMVIRYEILSLSDTIKSNADNENFTPQGAVMGKLSLLYQWHSDDPVDDFEMNRNNVIYAFQNNRNPLIDHPELFLELFNYLIEKNTVKLVYYIPKFGVEH